MFKDIGTFRCTIQIIQETCSGCGESTVSAAEVKRAEDVYKIMMEQFKKVEQKIQKRKKMRNEN